MRDAIDFGMAVRLGRAAVFATLFANAASAAATRDAPTLPAAAALRCSGPACANLAWPYATRTDAAETSDTTVSPRRIRVIPIHAAPSVR